MKGIPPELDAVIWAVAEDANPAAADEFIKRYPIYREELLKRKEALAGLKTSKPGHRLNVQAVPAFQHRPVRRVPPSPSQLGIVAALVLSAVAVASYTLTLFSSPRPVRVPAPAPKVVLTPLDQVAPKVVYDNGTRSNPPVAPPSDPTPPPVERTVEKKTPKYLLPQTLVAKQAPLHDLLKMLAGQASVEIVLAPGLPNPTIDVDYQDQNAVEILKDMGLRYHFTAYDQGDGSIVIYPAVDSRQAGGTPPERRLGG